MSKYSHLIIFFIVFFQSNLFSQNKKDLQIIINNMKIDSSEMIKSFNDKELVYKNQINKKEKIISQLNLKLNEKNKELINSYEKIKFIRDSIKFLIYKDAILEKYLYEEGIDDNIDGKLDRKQIGLIDQIALYDVEINDISDIKSFYNLGSIKIKNSKLKTIDLSGLQNLSYIYIKGCELEEINLNNCFALESLNISRNNLTKLNINDCRNLNSLDADDNKIIELIGTKNIPGNSSFQGSPIDTSLIELKTCNCLNKALKIIRENKDYDPNMGWPGGKEPSIYFRVSEIFMYGLCPEGCDYLYPEEFDSEIKKLQNFKMCSQIIELINNN